MNTMLKRGLHLGALIMAGLVILSSGQSSATSPVPIAGCTSVGPGNYILSQNITTTSFVGTCIIVAPNTAIDMNNRTMTSTNQSGQAIGDGGSPAYNVIIANGTINNWAVGIYMHSGGDSDTLTVDNVTVKNVYGDGIYTDSCCNTFTNIKSNNSPNGNGFEVLACCNTYANDQANGNFDEGIKSFDCCSMAFGVTTNGNSSTGLDLEGCCSSILKATVNSNHEGGIYVNDDDNKIENAVASFNTATAGVFAGGANNLIDHVTANSNTGNHGIWTNGNGNQVTNSSANSNAEDGIHMTAGTGGVALRDNTAANGSDGLFVVCPSNVTRLSSHNNGNLDLDLDTCSGDCTLINNLALNTDGGC